MERDGLTEAAARSRMAAQPSNAEYVEQANVVFSTQWKQEYTQKQVRVTHTHTHTHTNMYTCIPHTHGHNNYHEVSKYGICVYRLTKHGRSFSSESVPSQSANTYQTVSYSLYHGREFQLCV